jgi:hypothetical protein
MRDGSIVTLHRVQPQLRFVLNSSSSAGSTAHSSGGAASHASTAAGTDGNAQLLPVRSTAVTDPPNTAPSLAVQWVTQNPGGQGMLLSGSFHPVNEPYEQWVDACSWHKELVSTERSDAPDTFLELIAVSERYNTRRTTEVLRGLISVNLGSEVLAIIVSLLHPSSRAALTEYTPIVELMKVELLLVHISAAAVQFLFF